MSEADTCTKYGWTLGALVSNKCYQSFPASVNPNSTNIACTGGQGACCVEAGSMALHCPDRPLNTTPAASSSTSTSLPSTATVAKDNPVTFTPEIPIPGLFEGQINISSTSIAEYIRVLFVYFIWTVGILATVMVIYGGIKWVAAAGNAGRINDARDIVNNAVIGVIIALTSVVLLNIINPELTSLRGIDAKAVSKEYADLLTVAAETVGKCAATKVSGPPTQICTQTGDCSADGTLNDWINESSEKKNTSNWDGSPDPVMIKAIISNETFPDKNGNPISQPTGVKDKFGRPASSAYGIGQFVAGTLYEQLDRVERRAGSSVPSDCPFSELGKGKGAFVSATCQTWLDKLTSPVNSPPVGFKAQVFMVSNYLGELSKAFCVNGDAGRNAVAYFLGQGDVQYFCNPSEIFGATTAKQAYLHDKLPEAQKYLSRFTTNYNNYCVASGG